MNTLHSTVVGVASDFAGFVILKIDDLVKSHAAILTV